MYTVYDHEPTDGAPCQLCRSPSAVRLSDVPLCSSCYGREMNLSHREAISFLKDTCGIILQNGSVLSGLEETSNP